MTDATAVPKVYAAINAVQGDLASRGIGKGQRNEQQGYMFRGIDDVYNAIAPLLAKHGLCILPRCLERSVTERTNAKGTVLFYVVVKVEFVLACSDDGSTHVVGPMYGEAMDSGDKATNKAMSAAYKYALLETFAIPTEGDNDADRTTHEVALTSAQEVLLASLRDASLRGTESLKTAWAALGKANRIAFADQMASLKAAAAEADSTPDAVAA